MSNYGKGKKNKMEKEIVEEIVKECENWKERLLVRLFTKTYINAYHIGRIKSFNHMVE